MDSRLKTIDHAIHFDKFLIDLRTFMCKNNFKQEEFQSVLHLMNSFYFMGGDIENIEKKE